jgi:flagellar motor protein MotB
MNLYDDLKRKGGKGDIDILGLFARAAAKKSQPAPPPTSSPSLEAETVGGEMPSSHGAPEAPPPVVEIEDPLPQPEPAKSSAPLYRGLSPLAGGRPPPREDDRRAAIVAVAAGCGLLIAAFLVVGIARGLSPAKPAKNTASLQEPAEVVARKPAEAKPAQKKIQSAATSVVKPVELGGKGTRVTAEGNEKVVLFESGLFSSGAKLSREGESMLSNVGRQLAPRAKNVSITVIGCTDNLPVSGGKEYKDNKALGLLRAAAALRVLQSSSGIPTAAFKTVSYGVAWSPFPNNTAASRARNRTVVLRITGFQNHPSEGGPAHNAK